MKRVAAILLLLFPLITGWAQSNLIQAEYFFDSDPGMGSAIPIAGFASSATIDVNDIIDVSGLPIGMHTLGIRVMDDNNVWSMTEYIPVFITLASANIISNLTAAEYFFDIDPGMGAGTPITLVSTQNIDLNELFPTSALSLGMHTLNIRIRNEFNEWSMVETIPIFVTKASTLVIEDIDQIEYFFDTDPGIGLATPLVIASSQNIDINDIIPTGTLSIGMHTLNIRIRTSLGEWSLAESVPVFVNQDNLITQLEHFIDSDPGVGAATNISITPPANILDKDIIVPTGPLSFGSHTINVRIGGTTTWGQTESITFDICTGANADFTTANTCIGDPTNFTDASTAVLGGDLYAWDFDNDGSPDDLTTGDVSFTFPIAGTYTPSLAIDRIGCVGYKFSTIEVVDLPTANAGTDITICDTDLVSLSGLIGGSATLATWSSNGSGSFDDLNNPVATYTPSIADISLGTITLSLSASELTATCSNAISQIAVSIIPSPIVVAGIDQSICTTNTSVTANTPSVNETGTWSILSGLATINTPTNENTTITSISTPTVELLWTITNSIVGCTSIDTIMISTNQPITTSSLNSTVDIGQSVNINVQSAASINAGDVLTTTLTSTPTHGDAVVLADGTIDFTPYSDANSTDSFTFRLTNQCSNFDENTASISIVNQAPVINNASFTASTNTLEFAFDLTTLLSDPNNNLDFNSLRIVSQPISGAVAIIDSSGVLIIDYRGISYSGIDELEIEICDLVGVCTVQLITIPNVEVGGENPPIKVFNAVSPNGDGFHDFLEIENIEFYPNNTVIILNRWGDQVFKFQGYNNQDIVFESTTLPAGTYYYHVLSGVDEVNTKTGFFILKLDK